VNGRGDNGQEASVGGSCVVINLQALDLDEVSRTDMFGPNNAQCQKIKQRLRTVNNTSLVISFTPKQQVLQVIAVRELIVTIAT
jgi:cell fate (sporulation/competence/biofilm development) regulator YlbF (YheA/YmcA/DUF963 family)